MYKICVVTTTRAEYGLLTPILNKIKNNIDLKLELIVSGTHLMKNFGYTKQEILNDGFDIAAEIDWELKKDTKKAMCDSMSVIINKFSDYVEINKPDLCILLGDRFELLSFATVLVNYNIPIAHINGGEITEGAIDDCYRHCLTKMSTLHFANCELHRNRIIQMGEQPNMVFNVGDLSSENIKNMHYIRKSELEEYLKISLNNVAVVTFHPITTEYDSLEQLKELLSAIKDNPQFSYIITKANADCEGMRINKILDDFARNQLNIRVVESLGMVKFLSLLSYSKIMIGNSSSGIYEAPLFHIPTINIGNRQKGRKMPPSVISCLPKRESINSAIEFALSEDFQQKLLISQEMFSKKNTSDEIISNIILYLKNCDKIKTKKFYDINF